MDFKKNTTHTQFANLNRFIKNNFGEFIDKRPLNFLPIRDPTGKIRTIQYMARFEKNEKCSNYSTFYKRRQAMAGKWCIL